jgi:hypothetical protein
MTTLQTLNDSNKMNRHTIFGQAVFAILRKIKREATPPINPTQVASHFILPQRTYSFVANYHHNFRYLTTPLLTNK